MWETDSIGRRGQPAVTLVLGARNEKHHEQGSLAVPDLHHASGTREFPNLLNVATQSIVAVRRSILQ